MLQDLQTYQSSFSTWIGGSGKLFILVNVLFVIAISPTQWYIVVTLKFIVQ